MYTKEELEQKTNKELYEIAGKLNVSRYSHRVKKNKQQLIDSIIEADSEEKVVESVEAEVVEVGEGVQMNTNELPVVIDGEIVDADESEKTELNESVKSNRMRYIENTNVGTIVAFKLPNGKVKSAKVIKRSTSRRRFLVETSYGASFNISFDDVVWAKTGTRWPKFVYNMMKGIGDTDGQSE